MGNREVRLDSPHVAIFPIEKDGEIAYLIGQYGLSPFNAMDCACAVLSATVGLLASHGEPILAALVSAKLRDISAATVDIDQLIAIVETGGDLT